METNQQFPVPGDRFVRGTRRLLVLKVEGELVTLQGDYKVTFTEPLKKLLANQYQLERQPGV